jgi:plastocyanin
MRGNLIYTILFLTGACSGGSPTNPGGNPNPNPNPNPGANTITLNAGSFSPTSLTVTAGTEVRWVNSSGIAHTITPVNHSQWAHTTTSSAGTALTVTLATPGTFNYLCQLHSGMTGSVTVQ